MRPPPGSERRREERYLASGMVVHCGGSPCAAIDVSRSAVRFVRPASLVLGEEVHDLVLELPTAEGSTCYPVEGRVIRFTPICVVMGYQPPVPDWEQKIRALDTVELTTLEDL